MKNDHEKVYDVAIVGGGPAGLTAAMYLRRDGLDVVVIEKGTIGGLASLAARIENYPGADPVSGFDLCMKMYEQCSVLGVSFAFDRAAEYSLQGDVKHILLEGGDKIAAKNVVLALGARFKKLGLAREEELTGKGVSYCATCDGALCKNKTVAVIGGGNTAAEDALYLSGIAKTTYLIHRRDSLRADKIVADRLEKSNVDIIWDSVVTELVGEDHLTKLILKNVKTGALTPLSVDYAFVAIGQQPSTEGLSGIDTKGGYILTDENMRTNVAGVLAIGDVRDKSLRQVVTACADGAIAANSIIKGMA